MRKGPRVRRPSLRLIEGGFVGQDWPTDGTALALRILNVSALSPDARLVLRGLIDAHSMDHYRQPGQRDVFMDEELRFVGMFARMENLEKVRAALRELDQEELVRVQFLDAFRGSEERVRVRFDYGAIADLVGMRRKQHNAPMPGLAKAHGPDGQEPPSEPLTGSTK